MRLVCTQRSLAEGLAIVERAVPAKSPLPVLSNVLLATEGGRLKLVANNLEMAISAWVAANVADEGRVTLPARLLADFVSSLGGGDVQMVLKPGTKTMNLQCGRYEANINGIDAEDFPAVPSVGDGPRARIAAQALRTAINQVAFAAATDETRPVLAGVLLSIQGDQLTLAAADGFRLAVRTVSLNAPVEGLSPPESGEERPSLQEAGEEAAALSLEEAEEGALSPQEPPAPSLALLVPARALLELARITPDTEELMEIAATPNQNQVMFQYPAGGEGKAPSILLVSRLIEGQFPDYQRIIPKDCQTRIVLPVAEFLHATKTASVFSRDNSNIVRLAVKPSGEELTPGQVEVQANSAEMGDNVGQLDASVEGEEIQIAFNVRYLRDALEALSGGEVALEINGPQSPGLLKPVAEAGHLHVIMPMHISR